MCDPLPRISVVAPRSSPSLGKAERTVRNQHLGEFHHVLALVFTSSIGTPLDGTNVLHRSQRVFARAGLPRQRFHDLRHGCASLLLSEGLGLPGRDGDPQAQSDRDHGESVRAHLR